MVTVAPRIPGGWANRHPRGLQGLLWAGSWFSLYSVGDNKDTMCLVQSHQWVESPFRNQKSLVLSQSDDFFLPSWDSCSILRAHDISDSHYNIIHLATERREEQLSFSQSHPALCHSDVMYYFLSHAISYACPREISIITSPPTYPWRTPQSPTQILLIFTFTVLCAHPSASVCCNTNCLQIWP